MSDSFAHGRSLDSSAPTDSSVARNTVERNAQLLGFLQKNHLLETSQALAASMGSAALGAALAQRAASTQSSMDVMTAEHLAAALPELGHSLQESAGRGGSSLAPAAAWRFLGDPRLSHRLACKCLIFSNWSHLLVNACTAWTRCFLSSTSYQDIRRPV